jgi:hypothetical protein
VTPRPNTTKETAVATTIQVDTLIEETKRHLQDYRIGSGSGLESDACVNAAWHLRRDLEHLLPLVEQLLAQHQDDQPSAPVLTLARPAA